LMVSPIKTPGFCGKRRKKLDEFIAEAKGESSQTTGCGKMKPDATRRVFFQGQKGYPESGLWRDLSR
jgi:hypothetical protein